MILHGVWLINPVRELRPLTGVRAGGIKPPSVLYGNNHRLKSVGFSNGINDDGLPAGQLFLWAEELHPKLPLKKGKGNFHPYALSSKKIITRLKLSGKTSEEILLLPSYSSFPIPSIPKDFEMDEEPMLREWQTPGIIIDNKILNFLLLLDEDSLKEEQVVLGEDMVFLSNLSRFAIELLVKQRFLPALKYTKDKDLIFFWEPVFIGEDETKLFSHFENVLPDALRCTKSTCSKEQFVHHFLTTLINTTIDDTVSYNLKEFFIPTDDDYILDAQKKELLYNQFVNWSSPLKTKIERNFRTCFRLEPPDDDNKKWNLNFLLQSVQDPSLLVSLKEVWEAKDKTKLPSLNQDSLNLVFNDLGVGMRLFPPLERALKVSRPHSLKLDINEVYLFLKNISPLLLEFGFNLFVPSFWNKEEQRGNTVRLRIKATPSTSSAKFGLNQIVKFDWEIAVGDETISKEEFEKLVQLKIPLVNIRGQWVELQPEMAGNILKSMAEKGKMPLAQFLRLSLGGGEEQGLPCTEIEPSSWLKELIDNLKKNIYLEEIGQPEEFRGKLRSYQLKGLSWMAYMNSFGLGVCLADDMGLGKTIEFIALLLHQKKEGLKGPSLLLCPTSVIGNWEREIKRFGPNLNVLLHHGQDRLRDKKLKKEAKKVDLIITSYALIHRDKEDFEDMEFSYIVLDEAQNIKNPYTKQAQAVRSLKAQQRVALTGTPIENRLTELWSIMEFLNPGFLSGINEFKKNFAIPIERYNDEDAAMRLKRVVGPFILRRLKTDPKIISDLPKKMEIKTFCPLTKEQATLYQATVDGMMQKIESLEGINRKGEVLALLMKLKQICNHPALFLHDKSKIAERSGKLNRLIEMVDEVLEEKSRALVFTQFAEMGEMLKEYLEDKFFQEVLFLYGGTPRKKREEMIARFQSEDGPPLFVLSLKAGGLGLNLTQANYVFHFDRWWNPAVENQATDRAFRIGQKKNVIVHKFLCQGTVEEKIDEMLEKKKGLAEKIVSAGENWITELSTKELRKIFTLRKEAVME